MIKKVLKNLQSLNPYIYHKATTGSVYIKFKGHEWLGSLRIGDHEGRSKYSYKWNLRSDINQYVCELDKGVLRQYYPFKDMSKMCIDILDMAKVETLEFRIL